MYNVSTKVVQTKRHGLEIFVALMYVNGKVEYRSEFLSKGLALEWVNKKVNNFKGFV